MAGSAAAFMITGPATKITNLGAMKIVLGWKRFLLYFLYVILLSWITGIINKKRIIGVGIMHEKKANRKARPGKKAGTGLDCLESVCER